jgi:hypothetical protein
MNMIERLNQYVPTKVAFKGGPAPRVPDSMFVPDRRTMLPRATNTQVVNLGQGYTPAPFLRAHYLKRVVPFNIVAGNTIIFQSNSRTTKLSPGRSTVRTGAPPSLSSLIKPLT